MIVAQVLMHELPPLRHVTRQSVLDVHHAILPKTARLKPDSAKVLAASQPVSGQPRLRVLAPADMVLHAAAHLFLNEEFSNGLRDLVDLDSLLRHFGGEPGFWERLAVAASGPPRLLIPFMDALFQSALRPANSAAGLAQRSMCGLTEVAHAAASTCPTPREGASLRARLALALTNQLPPASGRRYTA